MNTEFFPHFIRANYPSIADASNEDLIEVGDEFKTWLEQRYIGKMDILKPIWDIDPKTVIMNQVNQDPFAIKGYHPAIFILFDEFVDEQKKLIDAEQKTN